MPWSCLPTEHLFTLDMRSVSPLGDVSAWRCLRMDTLGLDTSPLGEGVSRVNTRSVYPNG